MTSMVSRKWFAVVFGEIVKLRSLLKNAVVSFTYDDDCWAIYN